jgi:basic amino acid/polyamine antiporter, APA family
VQHKLQAGGASRADRYKPRMSVSGTQASEFSAEGRPSAPIYSRNATGLVREVGLIDMMLYNAPSAGGGVGFAIAFGLFVALSEFPRANIVLSLVIGFVLSFFTWMTCALLAATLPKTGGDYIYGSRLLHPVVGLGSNIASFVANSGFAAVTMYVVVSEGLAPAFQVIGRVSGNGWWLAAAATITERGWTLAITLALLGLLTVMSILGTRLVVRVMAVSFGVALVGFVGSLFIMLFKSRHGFVSDLNEFSAPLTHSANAYQTTIQGAARVGLNYPDKLGYSARSTIGALIIILGNMQSTWGIYLAGEFKGAGKRKRQLWVMLGDGIIQQALVVLGTIVFLSVVGYDFYAAANAGAYGGGIAPYYSFFVAVATHSTIIAVLVTLSFLGWFLPNSYVNLGMTQRAPFAWAFDGLVPRRLASVNDRTHTPVVAILLAFTVAAAAAVWASFSSSFFTVLSTFLVLTFVQYVVMGIAAAMMPRLHPEIYRGSAADWQPFGIPVLVPCGVLCAGVGLLGIGLTVYFHSAVGIHSAWLAGALPVAGFVIAAALYPTARIIQAKRGIDLTLVYKTIPPD